MDWYVKAWCEKCTKYVETGYDPETAISWCTFCGRETTDDVNEFFAFCDGLMDAAIAAYRAVCGGLGMINERTWEPEEPEFPEQWIWEK